jgi:hypothetical protein
MVALHLHTLSRCRPDTIDFCMFWNFFYYSIIVPFQQQKIFIKRKKGLMVRAIVTVMSLRCVPTAAPKFLCPKTASRRNNNRLRGQTAILKYFRHGVMLERESANPCLSQK